MTPSGADASLADSLVRRFGGRFSRQLGIDVDAGAAEVERWFLASTLFGTRISAQIAERTYRELTGAGINRVTDAGGTKWETLVALLDEGGYARYDFRTATRLQTLATVIRERYDGDVSEIGRRCTDPATLSAALESLPGWGPVTTGLFLRELRGVWPGARSPLDPRAAEAAIHLGLLTGRERDGLDRITRLARQAGHDERDLESALVRLALAHRRTSACPGGRGCTVLDAAPAVAPGSP
ncbi:MAG: hypothetical protein ACLQPH_03800 [Acidimicrobiales bacterium]